MIRFLRKKGRLKTKRGFQTAFGLYTGLNENGTIFLLPGSKSRQIICFH